MIKFTMNDTLKSFALFIYYEKSYISTHELRNNKKS